MTPSKVRHVSPRRDVYLSRTAKYLHIDIPNQNLKKVLVFCVSLHCVLCSYEVFPPVWWPPAGRGCRRFRGPAPKGLNQECYVFANPQMYRQMPFVHLYLFYFFVQESAIFLNKPFCTFRQNVATLDCLVRSSYPQLHGIVNLTQTLQGDLEIVLLSWQTFPLTDFHSLYQYTWESWNIIRT